MGLRRSVAAALVLAWLGSAVAQAEPRTESMPYLGVSFGVAVCEDDGTGTAVGGACFDLQPGDGAVRVAVIDDRGVEVAGKWGFYRRTSETGPIGESEVLDYGSFCGATGVLVVPAGAERLWVDLYPGGVLVTVDDQPVLEAGSAPCEALVTPGTTGVITAQFG